MIDIKRLRKRRLALGLSFRDLEVKTGLAKSTIHRIENGKVTPDIKTIEKLAKGLNVIPQYITGWTRNEGETPWIDDNVLACPNCGSGEYLHNPDENENDYCGQCGTKVTWEA